MEEFINVCVNNGLGIASFLALVYFMAVSMKKQNETLEEINKTLISIQTNMITMNERIQILEEKKVKKEGK